MERAVYYVLYKYLTENNLLNPKNAGFKQGDSTINQLVYLTNKISYNLDRSLWWALEKSSSNGKLTFGKALTKKYTKIKW